MLTKYSTIECNGNYMLRLVYKKKKREREEALQIQNKTKCPVNVLHLPNSETMETQA